MNLHQSAHGDREHGFIGARMRIPRTVVAGYWKDPSVQEKIADWQRAAIGALFSRNLKIVQFGDNMREVAVTEGDKVEAQIRLGWQVNTWAVGDLVKEMDAVTEADIDQLIAEYNSLYTFDQKDIESIRYQAREEIAIERILVREGAAAFSNTFEDLYGMRQLPGLSSQHLMAKGYGFGAEGDWKTAGLTAIIKAMYPDGAASFMEDYTYDFTQYMIEHKQYLSETSKDIILRFYLYTHQFCDNVEEFNVSYLPFVFKDFLEENEEIYINEIEELDYTIDGQYIVFNTSAMSNFAFANANFCFKFF